GRIETDYFRRTPQPPRPSRRGGPPEPPNTSASPHGMALNNDGSKLYIGTENADVSGVIVYDVKAARVLKKIDLLLEGGIICRSTRDPTTCITRTAPTIAWSSSTRRPIAS